MMSYEGHSMPELRPDLRVRTTHATLKKLMVAVNFLKKKN